MTDAPPPSESVWLGILKDLAVGVAFFGGVLLVTFAAIALMVVTTFPSREEIARVASPDGRCVAIMEEVNGGATTALVSNVYLARANGLGGRRKVLTAENLLRPTVTWTGPRSLVVGAAKARPFSSVPTSSCGSDRIEVRSAFKEIEKR